MFILVKRTDTGWQTVKVADTAHEMEKLLDDYETDTVDYMVIMLNQAGQKELKRAGQYMSSYSDEYISHYFWLSQWYKNI